MVFIVYESSSKSPENLKRILEPLVSKKQVENYCSIKDLRQRLQQPRKEELVGIFLPSSKEDLSNLLSINYLVRDIRIILVLPDRDDKTISIGHTLRPRFLTYADGDLSDVAAVMDKMMGNITVEAKQAGEAYA